MDIAEIAARCSGKATGGAAKAARPRRTGGGRRSTASAEKLQKATDGHAGRSAYRITLLRGCRKGRQAPSCAIRSDKPLWGGLEGRSPPTVIRTRRRARRVRKPCAVRFSRIDKWNTLLRGCRKGRQAPSCAIRSGGMYAARSGCKPLPLSCSARALRAQEHDVPFAARLLPALQRKTVDLSTV